MEKSISSLAFRGSIPEAITEAKIQKKLFVVYISGDNPDSALLDKSTWTDKSVAESLSKYCILLRISDGSMDAVQFSALYTQRSAPCITAIGYNGVQLWQNEGFVTAEVLASSLEKMWLSLHIQETTATFLTAALSSRKPGQLPYESSGVGTSSVSDAPSSSTDKHVTTSEATVNADPETEESKHCELPVEEIKPKIDDEVSRPSGFEDKLECDDTEELAPSPSIDTTIEPVNPVKRDSGNYGVHHMPFVVEEGHSKPEGNSSVVDQQLGASMEAPQVISDEAAELVKPKTAESPEVEKADILDLSTKSNDVHLNIRLPDSASLQEKFSVTTTLRIVKDFVDGKLESSIGSFDLAIPYPRKVFSDQDLGSTLSELGLHNRQALIVVPHQRAAGFLKGKSFLPNQVSSTIAIGSSSEGSEGYLSMVKNFVSYLNPLSYLSGGASSSSSVQDSQSSIQQYDASSTPQSSNFTGSRRSYLMSPNQTSPANGRNSSRSTQQTSSPFGSNIHTLRHDEDDTDFNDRNAFWNGNSTQYGGNSDDQ